MLVLTVIVVAILMSVIIITANTIAPAIMLSNVAGCMLEKLCVTNDNISIKKCINNRSPQIGFCALLCPLSTTLQ